MPEASDSERDRGIRGPHWIRYGTAADQRFLANEFRDTYDQLVVNGNMVAHMPSALSQFITQTARKPFVIDPQTHAFAHDLSHLRSTSKSSAGKIKRSWQKLIDRYGDPVAHAIGNEERPVDPDDFSSAESKRSFSERVLSFQYESITRELEHGDDKEYLEFLQELTGNDPFLNPAEILIAPYFFVDGPLSADWLRLNTAFIPVSREVIKARGFNRPLAAQIVISREFLSDKDQQSQIVQSYAEAGPDLVLLWVDQFSEHSASKEELVHYVALLDAFSAHGIPVVNLYGGFFSVALMRFDERRATTLAGVCHGLEYGETRPVIPLGGGTPVAKFYSRNLHHRLPPRIAIPEIKELGGLESVSAYLNAICDCANCREVVTNDPLLDLDKYFETKESTFWRAGRRVSMDFPTGTASENCTKHYLWCKHWEYRELDISLDALASTFANTDKRFRKLLGAEFAGHAYAWSEVFRGK